MGVRCCCPSMEVLPDASDEEVDGFNNIFYSYFDQMNCLRNARALYGRSPWGLYNRANIPRDCVLPFRRRRFHDMWKFSVALVEFVAHVAHPLSSLALETQLLQRCRCMCRFYTGEALRSMARRNRMRAGMRFVHVEFPVYG